MGDSSEKKAAHCDVDHGLGDVETLLEALGLSFPRGDRPTPQTMFCELTALSAS